MMKKRLLQFWHWMTLGYYCPELGARCACVNFWSFNTPDCLVGKIKPPPRAVIKNMPGHPTPKYGNWAVFESGDSKCYYRFNGEVWEYMNHKEKVVA